MLSPGMPTPAMCHDASMQTGRSRRETYFPQKALMNSGYSTIGPISPYEKILGPGQTPVNTSTLWLRSLA